MRLYSKKSLGQNFLIDKNILDFISEKVAINKNDIIIEIGPGTGNLTKLLITKNPKKFVVIEKDQELSKKLINELKDKVEVINNDFLNTKLNAYTKESLIVFGNLPYNVSTQILIKLIKLNIKGFNFKKLILMFQKEVADRIIANTNTKHYGRLAIISQWCMNIEKLKNVKPNSFFPIPKVESTLLSFEPKKKYFILNNAKNLEHVTNIFFNLKRKMIKKPISILFDDVDKISKRLHLNLNERPQNLSPNTFYKICHEYEKLLN
tara:strand:+ start:1474 stop:2265 length:792 start_codon:yes stop_codon:yes gene_type:complete